MTKIFTENFRASDFILDRVLNPNRDPEIGKAWPNDLVEACGIIPDFFCTACLEAQHVDPQKLTILDIADKMDELYGCGGFAQYPLKGTLGANGVYSYPDDPDLHPLARFSFEDRFVLYVYQYGICAVVDEKVPSKYRWSPSHYIARFD